jgi:hypothetical protein
LALLEPVQAVPPFRVIEAAGMVFVFVGAVPVHTPVKSCISALPPE